MNYQDSERGELEVLKFDRAQAQNPEHALV